MATRLYVRRRWKNVAVLKERFGQIVRVMRSQQNVCMNTVLDPFTQKNQKTS